MKTQPAGQLIYKYETRKPLVDCWLSKGWEEVGAPTDLQDNLASLAGKERTR